MRVARCRPFTSTAICIQMRADTCRVQCRRLRRANSARGCVLPMVSGRFVGRSCRRQQETQHCRRNRPCAIKEDVPWPRHDEFLLMKAMMMRIRAYSKISPGFSLAVARFWDRLTPKQADAGTSPSERISPHPSLDSTGTSGDISTFASTLRTVNTREIDVTRKHELSVRVDAVSHAAAAIESV